VSDWISPIERDIAADEYERLRAINAELLAALRLVVGLADNEAVESGDCRNPDNPFVVARAVIKKAEAV
jgi:hypothetical protein